MSAGWPVVLTIAGSDSGAGAGIQADLKTFAALGGYGVSAIAALTAQNTLGVRAIHVVPTTIVAAQIDALFEDFDITAVKIGMLAEAEIVETVANRLRAHAHPALASERAGAFVVYDPVMTASSGDPLSKNGFVDAIRTWLLPLVDCLTPNLAEAATLLGESEAQDEQTMLRQAKALIALGPRAVLIKGGHLDSAEAIDLLVTEDRLCRLERPRIQSKNLHGTGCTLSAALAARIALGDSLADAAAAAKAFVARAIEEGRDMTLGHGPGPLMQLPRPEG